MKDCCKEAIKQVEKREKLNLDNAVKNFNTVKEQLENCNQEWDLCIKENKQILGNTLVNPIALAEAFHYEYLKQSKKYGWNVQDGTSGKFEDLPEVNRMVMVYTCSALMEKRYLFIPKGRII